MQCPKCGFTSFDHNTMCPKCGKDVSSTRELLNLLPVAPQATAFLQSLLGGGDEDFTFEGEEKEHLGAYEHEGGESDEGGEESVDLEAVQLDEDSVSLEESDEEALSLEPEVGGIEFHMDDEPAVAVAALAEAEEPELGLALEPEIVDDLAVGPDEAPGAGPSLAGGDETMVIEPDEIPPGRMTAAPESAGEDFEIGSQDLGGLVLTDEEVDMEAEGDSALLSIDDVDLSDLDLGVSEPGAEDAGGMDRDPLGAGETMVLDPDEMAGVDDAVLLESAEEALSDATMILEPDEEDLVLNLEDDQDGTGLEGGATVVMEAGSGADPGGGLDLNDLVIDEAGQAVSAPLAGELDLSDLDLSLDDVSEPESGGLALGRMGRDDEADSSTGDTGGAAQGTESGESDELELDFDDILLDDEGK